MPQKEKEPKKFKTFLIRHYILNSVVLLLLILVLGYTFLIIPGYQNWQIDEAKINDLKIKLSQKKERSAVLSKLVQEYNQISPLRIDKIDKVLPYGPDLPNLYIQLAALAEENNLGLSSIKADMVDKEENEKISDNLGVVDVGLKLEQGNYQLFKRFISEVENNLRIFDIISLDFPEEINSLGLNLKTYYLK